MYVVNWIVNKQYLKQVGDDARPFDLIVLVEWKFHPLAKSTGVGISYSLCISFDNTEIMNKNSVELEKYIMFCNLTDDEKQIKPWIEIVNETKGSNQVEEALIARKQVRWGSFKSQFRQGR